jgi:dihydrofolate reductase
MTMLTLDISMSLDGFVAGPNRTLEAPLGDGGERLHEWAFAVSGFREQHGLSGGQTNVDNDVVEEALANTGATVMGRRMFSGGVGPWDDDPERGRLVGGRPSIPPPGVRGHPPRSRAGDQTGTEPHSRSSQTGSRLHSSKRGRRQAARTSRGANVAQQYLKAGLLDELQIHVVPVLL